MSFTRAKFENAAQFSDCYFAENAQFSLAIFTGYAGFQRAKFAANARFDEAGFQKSADFSSAVFLQDVTLGPCTAQELKISNLEAGEGLRVQCRAEQVEAQSVHCPGGLSLEVDGGIYINAPKVRFPAPLTLIYHETELTLKDIAFEIPTTIAAPAMTDGTATAQEVSQPSAVPQLLTLQRVDATNLTLDGLDLSRCRFLDCYNRDRLRIDGPLHFASSPPGRRWARRQTLAEEHHWRAKYDRRPNGWHSAECRGSNDEQPPPPAAQKNIPRARTEAARIQAVYRDLRKGREDAKDEPGAADFYYGEMEMRRFAAEPHSAERALLTAYWMLAGYGQRASRAIVALLLLLVLGTLGFATIGLAPTTHLEYHPVTHGTTSRPAVYQQVTVPGARPGWASALDSSIDSSTSLLRQNAQLPLTPIGRALEISLRLLGPLLLGLAVLALRGRVKR